MNEVLVGERRGKTRHYVDADRYKRLSRSKALCGKPGKSLIMYEAVYFNYEAVYPKMCMECKKALKEARKKEKMEKKRELPSL